LHGEAEIVSQRCGKGRAGSYQGMPSRHAVAAMQLSSAFAAVGDQNGSG